jgi:hypothetical protein
MTTTTTTTCPSWCRADHDADVARERRVARARGREPHPSDLETTV